MSSLVFYFGIPFYKKQISKIVIHAVFRTGTVKYRAETVWLTIRYALAWHDFPEGGQWVDFYEPMNRSDQPMPKVELKLKGEEK